jgi:cobalt-zinc-cadmium efflux system protein
VSLNIRGAYLEALTDLLASVGVVVAAVVLQLIGFAPIDPIVAIGIGIFILPRAWKLGGEAVCLLQAVPATVDVVSVEAEFRRIDGVALVHDLHVWMIAAGMDVASVHRPTAIGSPTASGPGRDA